MKLNSKISMGICLAVLGVSIGCNRSPETTAPTTEPQTSADRTDTNIPSRAVSDYAYAQRDAFAASMRADLARINAEIETLSAKLKNSSGPTRDEGQAKLDALREKAARLNDQLDRVKDASESTWEDVKAGAKKTFDELKDSFRQARQWLSEKIAP